MQIQPDNVGGLLREAGVGTDTPAATALQRDAMLAQHSPNLIRRDVGQRLGQQAAVPAGKPWWHRMIQLRQNAPFRLPAIAGGFSATRRIPQPIQPMPEKAAAPLAYRGRTRLQGRGNRLVRAPGRHPQNQPGAKRIALGAAGRSPNGITRPRYSVSRATLPARRMACRQLQERTVQRPGVQLPFLPCTGFREPSSAPYSDSCPRPAARDASSRARSNHTRSPVCLYKFRSP